MYLFETPGVMQRRNLPICGQAGRWWSRGSLRREDVPCLGGEAQTAGRLGKSPRAWRWLRIFPRAGPSCTEGGSEARPNLPPGQSPAAAVCPPSALCPSGAPLQHSVAWQNLGAARTPAGLVRTEHGEFWVEPAQGSTPSETQPQPHVVTRRESTSHHHAEPVSRLAAESGGRARPRRTRWRRSTSRESHVEALLVADASMLEYHREPSAVETYILTVMNMVASLYLDPSIGNPINIVVVRIVLLSDGEFQNGLNGTVNADQMLETFCRWQHSLNYDSDEHPNHHDVGILLTRQDLCARVNACSTLGVAHVAGMCQPERSCSVNEDNGLTVAHTIAHELGHNFGMYHDSESMGCERGDGHTMHVMTPSFESDSVDVSWSECSRRDITAFLDKGLGSCLEDEPTQQDYTYPDVPTGAIYSVEQQCDLMFSTHNATLCSATLEEVCERLWCQVGPLCSTILRPAAPGTSCGWNMWCQDRKCVEVGDRPDPVNGGWGEWGSWSECTRTCGAGISTIERECNNPIPKFGGKYCLGERRRYRLCNTQPCPEGEPNARDLQCSQFNNRTYNNKVYKWVPYYDKSEPCVLYCKPDEGDTRNVVFWRERVLDGTHCDTESRDVCISGTCRHVGCDWGIDSNAKEDHCGVCLGDGSQCKTFHGMYRRADVTGYKEVVIIPAGSRNIRAVEEGPSRNFVAVASATTYKYYLNGNNQIERSGSFSIHGTVGFYERHNERENITIPGPIPDDIKIYVLHRPRSTSTFGLRYEYTVPLDKLAMVKEYVWAYSEWSECTKSCGGGTQTSVPECREKSKGPVEDSRCIQEHKPANLTRSCNDQLCPTRWWTGPWHVCSVSCGEGGIRKRLVFCVEEKIPGDANSRDQRRPDSDCAHLTRPHNQESCPQMPPCIVKVQQSITSSQNSSMHNGPKRNGTRGRRPYYVGGRRRPSVPSPRNNNNDMRRRGWAVGDWSECSVTCGIGIHRRKVVCGHPRGKCDPKQKPYETKSCNMNAFCHLHWITGPWSQCSKTCGRGPSYKRREVRCVDKNTNRPAEGCFPVNRPLRREVCHPLPPCPTTSLHPPNTTPGRHRSDACVDTLKHCSAYKMQCNRFWVIKTKCCYTCSLR
ncbi:A disintegrin and metalloproteinase with thrombospondin motifs 12-like [Schistocerca serialis cubense]|uniref:A disintegrin and metalloproteinase with thrombospondin motifs 12-like n=1 Tax=Schistocerca serialis cubense TaxID=2023355 RepID=UPI00214EEB55|nr:A disintegrin and metalloproteinase with thrombospondin motifs 12-like [Schistocerca serialis cubense]